MSTTTAFTPAGSADAAAPAVLAAIQFALTDVAREWSGALPACAGGRDGGDAAGASLASMSDAGLTRVCDRVGALQHALDALEAEVAGALAARSGKERGAEGLAKSLGYASAVAMICDRWRVLTGRAAVLVDVGTAITPRTSLFGEVLDPAFPAVAAAIQPESAQPGEAGDGPDTDRTGADTTDTDTTDPEAVDSDSADTDGTDADAGADARADAWTRGVVLTVDGAASIVRELRAVGRLSDPGTLVEAEQSLVSFAAGAPLKDVRVLAVRMRTLLDQDGIEPRDDRLRRLRSLRIVEGPDGMTKLTAVLDPESAMWVRGAIDAGVTAGLRNPALSPTPETTPARGGTSSPSGTADDNPPPLSCRLNGTGDVAGVGVAADGIAGDGFAVEGFDGGSVMPECRTIEQRRVDALVDVCRHAAGCGRAGNELAPVNIVVRMQYEDLRDGIGAAFIDGATEPVSAATVRRLAGDANLIPEILTGPSEVLDLGRKRRLFTAGQRTALVERDGGCAWAGCPHPPGYTQAHHIRWWSTGGRTDLDNGILLCSHHHHRVHADGWGIRVRDTIPWFIPPPHVDPARTPRRGGRLTHPATKTVNPGP